MIPQFKILYEDPYLLAINKPPRVASVPSENIPIQKTVLGQLKRQFQEKNISPYLLHRLDYATSGILLCGKYERDRQALESIWRNQDTHKKYIAAVIGLPRGNVITKKLAARGAPEKIPAQTNYKILKTFRAPSCTLIEAEIKTGRKHQIRKHFASIGHPIILDAHYGDARFNRKFRLAFRLGRQFLHAASVSFFHPFLKKHIRIEAPLPMDLQSVLKRLSSL